MLYALKRSIASKPNSATILSNIFSGLTVGVIALPLSMALAIASGVAPQHGLYTAIIAGIFIAIFGGSKVNISGPTAAFVVVLLPIVHQYGLGGLLISGLMAGLILMFMGFAKLGKLVEVVPYPVTIGFTAGIGVTIATFQLKDFLGLQTAELNGHYIEKVTTLAQGLPSFNYQEALIGLLTLAVLLGWAKVKSRVPGHLVGLLVGTLAALAATMLLPNFEVATLGSQFNYTVNGVSGNGIPPVLPTFEMPWNLPNAKGEPIGLSFDLIRELLPSAITIAILGALESLLCAVVSDGMSGKKHSPNDELIGQGIGNIIAPFFGGIPATAAIARTAANVKAGGSLPLSAIVHSIFLITAILLLAPVLAYIPMASMAALLIVVAWNMSEAKHFIRVIKVAPRSDVTVLLLCFILTVLFDMTIAVAVGIGLAAILFINHSIKLTQVSENDDKSRLELPETIALYNINGSLFFGSAQKASRALAIVNPQIKVVIIEMSKVSMLDMSAIMVMESISQSLLAKDTKLVIANLQPRMILKLRRAGIRKQLGKIEFARSLDEGIFKAKRMS